MDSMRPHVVVHNVASMDGRLTLAPGVDLMAGDERWTAMTADLPDPYAWARTTHDPQVFLVGSGSFLNPVGAALQGVEPAPAPEGVHFLPDDVVGQEVDALRCRGGLDSLQRGAHGVEERAAAHEEDLGVVGGARPGIRVGEVRRHGG